MGALQGILGEAYSTDPVNWVKWVIVYAVLIIGYIVMFPIYKKVSYFISYRRKRDIAMSRNHVIQAKRIKSYVSIEDSDYSCHGTYTYIVDGKEKKYRALFKNTRHAPVILYLYYVDNPKKVFAYDEYHWQNHKGIILLILIAIPWILAAVTMLVLKVDYSGFM